MDIIATKDATELLVGDWAVIRPGIASRVTRETDLEQHGCATLHTENGSVLASLPCPTKVVDPTTLTDDEKWSAERETAAATDRMRAHLAAGGTGLQDLMEWVAEHSTDPTAREFAARLFSNLEDE